MAHETTQAPLPKQAKDEPQIHVTEVKPAASAKEEPMPAESTARAGRADAIIRRNVLWALGAGLVPLPILDLLAITGVQLKMLSELSALYDTPFRKEIAKKILGSLFSSVMGLGVGTTIGGSFAKLIPTVGTALGIVTVPVVAGAFTLATGKVFLMHFESGGTILDFDPKAMRAHFKQEFQKGKETAAQMHEEEKARAAKTS